MGRALTHKKVGFCAASVNRVLKGAGSVKNQYLSPSGAAGLDGLDVKRISSKFEAGSDDRDGVVDERIRWKDGGGFLDRGWPAVARYGTLCK